MKLFSRAIFLTALLLLLKPECLFSAEESQIAVTGNYTETKLLQFIRPIFDQALKEQGIDPRRVKISFVTHYEVHTFINKGDVAIACRPKTQQNRNLNWCIPIAVYYNQDTFNTEHLNFDKSTLKEAIESGIHGTPYKNLGRPLKISAGAISGHTRRALAFFIGVSYDQVKKLGERQDITNTDRNFIKNSIEQGYDIILLPDALVRTVMNPPQEKNIRRAAIEGKNPTSNAYPLYDTIAYISYKPEDSKDPKLQEAVAKTLEDPSITEALRKYNVRAISKETLQRLKEERPDLYAPETFN